MATAQNSAGCAIDVDRLIADTVRRVAELPDRMSPDDSPEMMLVTADELAAELRAFADDLLALKAQVDASAVDNRDGLRRMLHGISPEMLARAGIV
jgi:hypothetical protein